MIFLSYARSDGTRLAEDLASRLKIAGFEVWLDRQQISAGTRWSQAIEGAIDRCTRVVALLTPASYNSGFCRGEQMRALRLQKPVVPVLAGPGVDRPLYLEGSHYLEIPSSGMDRQFIEDIAESLCDESDVAPLAPEWQRTRYAQRTAPKAEPRAIRRDKAVQDVVDLLLRDDDTTTAVALVGMAGTGKTVLARQIIDDPVLQAAFHDGLLWATFGTEVDESKQLSLLQEFVKELDPAAPPDASVPAAARQLRASLQNKAVLVILDDVWKREHIDAFLADAKRCRVLITTRNWQIARATGAVGYEVPELDQDEALELLAAKAGKNVEDLPVEAGTIARRAGRLPMTLALVGSSMSQAPDAGWRDWEQLLDTANFAEIETQYSEFPNARLMAALKKGWEMLGSDEARQRYLELAVFPKDIAIPESALQALFPEPARPLIKRWLDQSLAKIDDCGQLLLHSLQSDFVRRQCDNLPALHGRLAAAIGRLRDTDPKGLFADPYLANWYIYHLANSEGSEAAEHVLCDPEWLRQRLDHNDVVALIHDFRHAGSDVTRRIGRALQLSAHALRVHPEQLAGQLTARLLNHECGTFLADLARSEKGPWLQPLRASLTPPGSPLVRLLTEPGMGIRTLAITADSCILAGSEGGIIRKWDLRDGAFLGEGRDAHRGPVHCLAVDPNLRYCLSTGDDGYVRIWDLASLELIAEQRVCDEWHSAAAAFAGSHSFVAGTDSGELLHCRITEKNQIDVATKAVLNGHCVRSVAVPDVNVVATGGTDGKICLWDLPSGKQIREIITHTHCIRSLVSRGDCLISASDDGFAALSDWRQGFTKLRVSVGAEVTGADYDKQTRELITASLNGVLTVWDGENGRSLRTINAHMPASMLQCMAFDCGRKLAVTGTGDRLVAVWSTTADCENPPEREHRASVFASAVSADGRVAVTGCDERQLRVWEIGPAGVSLKGDLPGHNAGISGIALSRCGKRACSCARDHTVRAWDIDSGTEIHKLITGDRIVNAIALGADYRTVIGGASDGSLLVWRDDRPAQWFSADHCSSIEAIAVDGSGATAVSGSEDYSICFWSIEQGAVSYRCKEHVDVVREVAVSADGSRVLTGGGDSRVLIWDGRRRVLLGSLDGHSKGISALAISPDGKLAVTGSYDRTIRVWDVPSCAEIACLEVEGPVHSAAWSSESRIIVCGDELGRVHFLRLHASAEAIPSLVARRHRPERRRTGGLPCATQKRSLPARMS